MAKKTIQICGTVLEPLAVGRPAYIRESDGSYRRTTTVQSLESVSVDEIHFETKNTLYRLHLLSSVGSRTEAAVSV